MCNNKCKVVLSKDHLGVIKNNKIILKGHRNRQDDLWDILITKTTLTKDNLHVPQQHSGIYIQNRHGQLEKEDQKCMDILAL